MGCVFEATRIPSASSLDVFLFEDDVDGVLVDVG